MATDEKTIAVYNAKVDEYHNAFSAAEAAPALTRFMEQMPAGAHVLDLGCGPGTHSAAMHGQGLTVTATDASASMVKMARTHKGIDVLHVEFSDLQDRGVYDGIWANFSLLHEPRSRFSEHLSRISTALKPNGILHLGMKVGQGERRDHLGRFYTYYSSNELHVFLRDANFQIIAEHTGEGAGLAGTVDPWIEILSQSVSD